jgi:hypothetical protein
MRTLSAFLRLGATDEPPELVLGLPSPSPDVVVVVVVKGFAVPSPPVAPATLSRKMPLSECCEIDSSGSSDWMVLPGPDAQMKF